MRLLSLPPKIALLLAFLPVSPGLLQSARAQHVPDPVPPTIVPASEEGAQALSGFKVMEGIQGNLFAAEPMFANAVAFFVDDQGQVFVCETFRQEIGVVDNRGFDDEWVDADLASQSVEDRRKYHLELLGDRVNTFMEQDDQIRLLIDLNQDGVADESFVFANKFNDLVDGTGAGVLAYKGNVYYTCIPSLYVMRDENGDHQADGRAVLHTGFGVRVAFRGHDMHGLVIGPDGRLYFSIGDRGANVDTPNGQLLNVESGSVFRCELDGSQLELFATGLRNPQELAFDNYGNLFTGDNNSDSGDQARWVNVVEGGDSGWRMAYQYLADRGPFNRERIWEPMHEGQPAYIIPPIANISDGPSGLDFYPGTGFGDTFKDQFLLADFRGTALQSGIRSLRNEPQGAFFRLAEDGQPFWSILATDVQFGPDGAVYISDWVDGWQGEGKGRIYRFISGEHHQDAIVQEVQDLLASAMSEVESDKLATYLKHADRRVRLKAQLELATRGDAQPLMQAATQGTSTLERLHGIWGLDQLSRQQPEARDQIRSIWLALVEDDDAEIRAQVTRLLGEVGGKGASEAVLKRLTDEQPRVRYFALMSIRQLAIKDAFEAVVREIEANLGRDPVLRHGGAMALTTIANEEQLIGLAAHTSKHVRLAAVVALRRLGSPTVAAFLTDHDPDVVAEAARAINDAPIEAAMPQLADLIDGPLDHDSVTRRVLNANFRQGHADAIAKFASNPANSSNMREEALTMLDNWQTPSGRDRVTGMWRPISPRSSESVKNAMSAVLGSFTGADASLRLQAAKLAGSLGIENAAPLLRSIFQDDQMDPRDRADAFVALVNLDGSSQADMEQALTDEATEVRAAALGLVQKVMPDAAAEKLAAAALEGETLERQMAIKLLGEQPAANESLLAVLEKWADGELPAEAHLEALQAAESFRSDPRVAALLAQVNTTRDPSKPLDTYREALHGGDARRGRTIFWERASVSCLRCHKVAFGGGEVGPELTRIAVDKNREYLLESIVDPNKVIAKGFESALLLDFDGNVHTGVVREETDTSITLIDAEGKLVTFDKDDIESRKPAKSAMPDDMVKQLTKAELRDLVEYLSTLDGRSPNRRRRVQ